MATYEESVAQKRQHLHERIDLYLAMQRLGDLSAAQMASVLEEAAEELRVLDELDEPIARDGA